MHSKLLNRFHISAEEVRDFRSNHAGFSGIDRRRVSSLLLAQLVAAGKHGQFDPFSVTDVIQALEDSGRALEIRTDIFKHPPLEGLWKAHFFDARFILKNLINQWRLESERDHKFEELCMRIASEEDREPTPGGWQHRLSHELVIGGFKRRASKRKLTGEWIIYGKLNDNNIYLCLARHTKNKGEDATLYNSIVEHCASEFPLLFKHPLKA